MEKDRCREKLGKRITKTERHTETNEQTASYLHIEVVMSRVVGMEDKLLNQVSCRVKQDILKNKKNTTEVQSTPNSV